MTDKAFWDAFKGKLAEAFANLLVWGAAIVVSWAVLYALLGKKEIDQIVEGLNIRMTNEYNEGVQRDADLLKEIRRLRTLVDELNKTNNGPPPGQAPPPAPPAEEDYIQQHRKPYAPIQEQRQAPPDR